MKFLPFLANTKYCSSNLGICITRGSLASLGPTRNPFMKANLANYEISIYIIISLEGKSYTSR